MYFELNVHAVLTMKNHVNSCISNSEGQYIISQQHKLLQSFYSFNTIQSFFIIVACVVT